MEIDRFAAVGIQSEEYKKSAQTLQLCLEKAVQKEVKLKDTVAIQLSQIDELRQRLKAKESENDKLHKYNEKMVSEVREKHEYVRQANRSLVELTKSLTTLEKVVKKQHVLLKENGVSIQ